MITPRPELLATPAAHHGGRLGLNDDAERARVRYDFSTCLNAFGPAEVVARAIRECPVDEYPDPWSLAPRRAAADRWGCSMDEVIFGSGAAELIQAVCFAFLRAGDQVLIHVPAFGEYARAAALCGASVHEVGSLGQPASSADLISALHQCRPRLMFLASPGNPTGALLPIADITRLADACAASDGLLVLDQAYDGFCAVPVGMPALPGHAGVLHIRSLTKDHALAGVRAAFGVGPRAVIAAVERVRPPWSASAPAQSGAAAAMTEAAMAEVDRTTTLLRREAGRIAEACAAVGLTVHPSATHYRLVDCGATPAPVVRDRLLVRAGILVRDGTSFGLPTHIRIAARRPDENDALIAALPLIRTPRTAPVSRP